MAGNRTNGEPAFAWEFLVLLGDEIGAEDARALLRDFMTDASARLQILETGCSRANCACRARRRTR